MIHPKHQINPHQKKAREIFSRNVEQLHAEFSELLENEDYEAANAHMETMSQFEYIEARLSSLRERTNRKDNNDGVCDR